MQAACKVSHIVEDFSPPSTTLLLGSGHYRATELRHDPSAFPERTCSCWGSSSRSSNSCGQFCAWFLFDAITDHPIRSDSFLPLNLSILNTNMATSREHGYAVQVRWTGNRGEGTSSYRGYERNHDIKVGDRPVISGSSDPAFRGDKVSLQS